MAELDQEQFRKLSPQEKVRQLQRLRDELEADNKKESKKHQDHLNEIEELLKLVEEEQDVLERSELVSTSRKNESLDELTAGAEKPKARKGDDKLESVLKFEKDELSRQERERAESISGLPSNKISQYFTDLYKQKPSDGASKEEKQEFYSSLRVLEQAAYLQNQDERRGSDQRNQDDYARNKRKEEYSSSAFRPDRQYQN